VSTAFALSGITSPLRSNWRFAVSIRNGPNSKTCLFCLLMRGLETVENQLSAGFRTFRESLGNYARTSTQILKQSLEVDKQFDDKEKQK
jgi:hypothetical protein